MKKDETEYFLDLDRNGDAERTQPHILKDVESFELGYFTRDRKYHVVGNVVNPFSEIAVKALQNDKLLISLYKGLNNLYSTAIPKVIQVLPTEFKVSYGEEFDELVSKFHQEIKFRQEQILSFYRQQTD